MNVDSAEFYDCRRCVCSGLRRAARLITQHFDRLLRPTGLRPTQFTLLATLLQTGPLPMNRLARHLGMDRTTLTRNLAPLAAKGWLVVEEDEDRRVRSVSITANGTATARSALPLWRKAQASAGARLAELHLGELLAHSD
jgi:DNA-binding MarR family transcriptional regulator